MAFTGRAALAAESVSDASMSEDCFTPHLRCYAEQNRPYAFHKSAEGVEKLLKLCRERPGASGRERTYKVLAEVAHSGLLGGKPGNSKTKALIWWVVNGETGAGQKTEQLPA